MGMGVTYPKVLCGLNARTRPATTLIAAPGCRRPPMTRWKVWLITGCTIRAIANSPAATSDATAVGDAIVYKPPRATRRLTMWIEFTSSTTLSVSPWRRAGVPATSIAELVKLARSKPGELNYASAGVGSPAHLAGEMFNLLADVKISHVPYKGAGPALLDVIAGNAQLIITSPIAAGAHMNAGRVRALATTGVERNPGLPTLPTIAETLPGYEITQTWGIAVPAGTAPAIIKRLSDEVIKVMNMPDVRERVLATGAVPIGDTPEAFTAFMNKERQQLGEVIVKRGIELKD